MKKKLCIYNESCQRRLNRVLNASREKYDITLDVAEADWLIFVGCASTDNMLNGLDKELARIFKIKKPECKVIITGCVLFAKECKRAFLNKYAIDYIVPVKKQVEDICSILNITPSESTYSQYDVPGRVEIGDGCLNRCSFCRIHYCNREFYSIPMEKIEKEVKDLVAHGVKVISIISLNTAQYGIDLYGRKMLHELLRRISKIHGIEYMQVQSLSLSDMYDELIEEIKGNKLICSVSIDIQSGSDKLLKLMNVGHDVQRIEEVFRALGEKVGFTQVISGFPGETEEDVYQTIKLLKKLNVRKIYVSRYRDSIDTPSGKMKQLSEKEANSHYSLYKNAVREIEKELEKRLNGKTFVGYIHKFNMDFLGVYCPEYRYCGILMKKEYFSLNLNDKVLVKLVDGNCFLEKVLRPSSVETEPTNQVGNDFLNYIIDYITLTTEYAPTEYEIQNKCEELFERLGGKKLSFDEFKERISLFPDSIAKAWIKMYEKFHN